MDAIRINDRPLHKTCLRCTHCNTVLSVGKYAAIQGKYYCKPHFKQLFAIKGNYTDGFTATPPSDSVGSLSVVTSPISTTQPETVQEKETGSVKERVKEPEYGSDPTLFKDRSELGTLVTRSDSQPNHLASQPLSPLSQLSQSMVSSQPLSPLREQDKPIESGRSRASTLGTRRSSAESLAKNRIKLFEQQAQTAIEGKSSKGSLPNSANSSTHSSVESLTNRFDTIQSNSGSTTLSTPSRATSIYRSGNANTNGTSNTCPVCQKTVYPMEQVQVDGIAMHKACLKCEHCGGKLKPGNFAALEGKYYCKPHFKQLFALKGNYNEGFGTRPHKEKWQQRDGTNEAGAECS